MREPQAAFENEGRMGWPAKTERKIFEKGRLRRTCPDDANLQRVTNMDALGLTCPRSNVRVAPLKARTDASWLSRSGPSWNPRLTKRVFPLRYSWKEDVAMGDVVDFNLARLKRCLPMPDQGKLLEARIASLASDAGVKPELVKEVIRLMRRETLFQKAGTVLGTIRRG
jgi:hypothetical protein